MTRCTRRVSCAYDGCRESAHYEYSSQREMRESISFNAGRPWFCTRHTNPDAVMSMASMRRTHVVVSQRTECTGDKLFWKSEDGGSGNGFAFGPGFKAWANDFPEGTALIVTAEVVLPVSVQGAQDGAHKQGETR